MVCFCEIETFVSKVFQKPKKFSSNKTLKPFGRVLRMYIMFLTMIDDVLPISMPIATTYAVYTVY